MLAEAKFKIENLHQKQNKIEELLGKYNKHASIIE